MRSMQPIFNKNPLAMSNMLTALNIALSDSKEIVLVLVDKAETAQQC